MDGTGPPDGGRWAAELEAALGAAGAAAVEVKAAWGGAGPVRVKGAAADLVTETDLKCEGLIRGRLAAAFPGHRFIGEEESAALGCTPELTDAPTWLVDPVDGTTNFVHGYPFTCVCVGLAVGRQMQVGVVTCPPLGEVFCAVRGGGAWLNGKKIRVSQCRELSNALVATEIGVSRDVAVMDAVMARVRALTEASRSLRCCGSHAMQLCGVAAGRLDVFFEIGFGGPWDCAAGSLIVEEAGGQMLDPSGASFDLMSRRSLAACSGDVARQAAQALAVVPEGPGEPRAP